MLARWLKNLHLHGLLPRHLSTEPILVKRKMGFHTSTSNTFLHIFKGEAPKQAALRQGTIIPIILWINTFTIIPPNQPLKCRWPQRRVCPFFVPGEEIPLWSLECFRKMWRLEDAKKKHLTPCYQGICKGVKNGSILNIHDSWTNTWFKKSEALNQTCEIRGVVAVACIQIILNQYVRI